MIFTATSTLIFLICAIVLMLISGEKPVRHDKGTAIIGGIFSLGLFIWGLVILVNHYST